MFIFVAPNHSDHHRFNRFFMKDEDIKITYDSLRDVVRLSKLAYRDDITFIFNGLCPPDIFALKFVQSCHAKIILLQHNSQVPQYTYKQVVKKFLSDKKTYFSWAIICFYFSLLSFFRKLSLGKKLKCGPICFIYGNSYKEKINSLFPNSSINLLPEPNMLIYGSNKDIKITDTHVGVLFIDEPFETTLGCNSSDLVQKIIDKNEKEIIYIKLHPRSETCKYNALPLDYIRFIDYIPSSINKLYGFKSNLFTYIKVSGKRYVYKVELDEFELTYYENCKDSDAGSYIENVKDELNKLKQ